MNKIIESFLNTHIQEYELEKYPIETAFEHFINKCIINKYASDRVDPDDVMTEKGEKGLDGVAILINEQLVTTIEDTMIMISKYKPIDVRFVFIQSKTSESFSGSEIGDFIYGVKAFFEEESKRPVTNEKMENLIKIKDEIYKHSVDFENSPTLDLYYVCCGKWDDTNGLQNRINTELVPLIDSGNFSNAVFYKYDSEKIITTYKEMKKKISRNFVMEKKVTFPNITGVTQAYIGFVKCKEFIEILKDSDGNMLTNIFEDNVRDFQGYNLINQEIKETILDNIDQSRFAVLNNGITIVAKNIKVTGDNVELFDYQIVNGCQTSNVLYDNRNSINDYSHLVIKVIEVKDEVISDRIIFTTNRQTEVKSEAFIATKIFHKKLQDFYNAVEPSYKLYYERRSKQYDLLDNVSKIKVVTLTTQITSYISMFLNEPHSTHRYYGELLEAYKNRIFLDSDGQEVYYIASYCNYYIEMKFKSGELLKKYKKFKFHLLCAIRGLYVGNNVIFGKERLQKKEFKILFEVIKDTKKMDNGIKTAIMCLDKVLCESTTIPESDKHRSREITIRLLDEVKKVTEATNSNAFLKFNDVVHCTVIGVNESFVYVSIKTEDSRNEGSIHISKVTGNYINDLKKEVEIGEIFQAKIINEDYYSSNWGWELTKLI